jgi:hypothetical protein
VCLYNGEWACFSKKKKPFRSAQKSYFGTFEIHATLCENLHVEILSQILPSSAEMVAIMAVRQFPPAEEEA